MKPEQLRNNIDSLMEDVEFQYKGVWGSICPFSRENISVSYGDLERTFDSVDAAMNEPFIEGKPMKEICTEFII